jgi:hypothetical protein
MLGIYVVLFFAALVGILGLSGCVPYRSKGHEKETSIKMDGEEFKIVDDVVYPENIYHIKVVHITI